MMAPESCSSSSSSVATTTTTSRSTALIFSPPQRKEVRPPPSEFLLLKPFSKAPSLQMNVAQPGRSQATLLSIQNIDDTSTRVYFEIPPGKPLIVRPETVVMAPQSVECFEVIVMEPKESFRATIKVFAPDIKFYRGGQVNVTVTVKEPVKVEKKKKRLKPTGPTIKPKAVTVPAEFRFQPSRQERKKCEGGLVGSTPLAGGISKSEKVVDRVPPTSVDEAGRTFTEPFSVDPPAAVLRPIDQTFNLDDIRRQTNLIKTAVSCANQTYVVPPKLTEVDVRDPIAFARHAMMANEDSNLRSVAINYLSIAKARGENIVSATELQRKETNRVLQRLLPAIQGGQLMSVFDQLAQICKIKEEDYGRPEETPSEANVATEIFQETRQPYGEVCGQQQGDAGNKENTRPLGNSQIIQVRGMEKPRRSSNLTTSSPKMQHYQHQTAIEHACMGGVTTTTETAMTAVATAAAAASVELDTPERLSGMSQKTVGEMVSTYLPDGISPLDLLTVPSPNVSAIYPISGEGTGKRCSSHDN